MQFRTNADPMPKTNVQGMTVFNTSAQTPKSNRCSSVLPLSVQRYDSYRYPVFDRLTTQQLGYFWRPEEVSLQKDRADYQTKTRTKAYLHFQLEVSNYARLYSGSWSWYGIQSILFYP